MKKILAIAAVLILLLTLTVPALAVDSVTAGPETITAEDGSLVVVGAVDKEAVDVSKLVVVVNKLDSGVDGVELFDIYTVDASGNRLERNTPITADIPFEKAQQVVAVLLQNADGSWSDVPYTSDADSVLCRFGHLTPVAFPAGTPGRR